MNEVEYSRLEADEEHRINAIETDKGDGDCSALAATANIANVVIGAGVLALPFAYARSGTIGGPILVCFSGLLNIFTMHLLSAAGRKIAGRNANFHAIAAETLPKKLWWLVDGIVCVMMAMLAASYVIVFGNLCSVATEAMLTSAPKLVRTVLGSRESWVCVGVLVVAPLSYAKSLDVLKYTSMLGLVFMLYIGALVTASWIDDSTVDPCMFDGENGVEHCGGDVKLGVFNLGSLEALALSTFSYTAQTQVPSVANALRDYSQPKMDRCIVASVTICAVLYCIIGHAGYETFGNLINSDLLESYHASPMVTIARFAISFVVSFSYPLMCMPFRHSLKSILENQTSYPTLATTVKNSPDKFHYLSSTGFLSFSLVVALFVDDLGLVLSLIGATAATAIAYIIPTWAYVKTFADDVDKKWRCRLARVVGCYGVVVMPFCVASTFISSTQIEPTAPPTMAPVL